MAPPPPPPDSPPPARAPLRLACRVLLASAGNFLEWYDFAAFGIFAPEIGAAFFPSSSADTALLRSFSVFAGAFLARPLGGVLFGHIGDRFGRERALMLTILMMAISTVTIGLLPTYSTAGFSSTFLLVLCRLLQGLAAGGELPGALVYAVESASPRHVGFFGALVQATGAGSLLASLVRSVLHLALGEEGIMQWGWRVPFLLGGVLASLTSCLRQSMKATPAFMLWQQEQRGRGGTEKQEEVASKLGATSAATSSPAEDACPSADVANARAQPSRVPLLEMLRQEGPSLARVGLASVLGMIGFYMLFIWMPSFLRQ